MFGGGGSNRVSGSGCHIQTYVRLLPGKLPAGKLPTGKLPTGKLPAGNQTYVRPARAHAQRTDAHTSVALCIGSVTFLVQTLL